MIFFRHNLLIGLHNVMWHTWLAECFTLKTSYLLIQLLFYASFFVGFTLSKRWFFNFGFLIFRQELFYLLKDEKEARFQFRSVQKDWASKTSRGMHSSKFCLDIASDTPSSNRLIDAIASHCVPVIISDDIEFPYEDVIDYSQFCISVRTSNVVREKFLVNLISSIKNDEWTRMWKRLKEVENFWVPISIKGRWCNSNNMASCCEKRQCLWWLVVKGCCKFSAMPLISLPCGTFLRWHG